jgi:hypothetical protein
MPFITKKGKPVWITPQRDKNYNWGSKESEYSDTIKGVKIPDYILNGKDDYMKTLPFGFSTEKEKIEHEKEYRDSQKSSLKNDIMRKEMKNIEEAKSIYLDSWLAHNKKKENNQIELSINKTHKFHGKVYEKNRERNIEYL